MRGGWSWGHSGERGAESWGSPRGGASRVLGRSWREGAGTGESWLLSDQEEEGCILGEDEVMGFPQTYSRERWEVGVR